MHDDADPEVNTRMKTLLDEHGPPLTRFVLGLTLGQRQTAEDLVQETIIRAWRNIDGFPRNHEDGRRWLFTVARRLVIDSVRRQRARPAEAPLSTDQVVTGDETSSAALANQSLRDAVRGLGAAHREVIHEIYVRNRSVQEVADRLDIPVGTVRSRVHYAIRHLRSAVIS
nr:sigma-70 family RNA polymerase sigma factor [uncultured Actinoplanes sp.]